MSASAISPAAVHAAQLDGTPHDLIDVRSPAERAELHAVGSRCVAMDISPAELPTDKPIYVLCGGGTRARHVCDRLIAAGMTNVQVVDGGTRGWATAGLPVVRGQRRSFGVERQTRTIIGAAVVAGVLLAWLVHPGWIWLSGFFGAGLLMAGLTDYCGLALLLAAMPWNRASAAGANCSVKR